LQRENGGRGRAGNGRFAKKSGAGDDTGVDELGRTREHWEWPEGHPINVAPSDRPGVASVENSPREELVREALAAVASAPIAEPGLGNPSLGPTDPDPAGVAGPSDAEVLAGYEMVCTQLIDSGCTAIIPAWRVTPLEVSKLSTACSKALMLWFPDMIIPPKYMALLVIVGVGFEIAQARKDPSTGRYRPAQLPDRAPDTIDGTPATNAAAPAH
jgi:hypothetical protein